VLALIVAWSIATGATGFTYYPVLDPLLTAQSAALAAAGLAVLALSALALVRTAPTPSGVGPPDSP